MRSHSVIKLTNHKNNKEIYVDSERIVYFNIGDDEKSTYINLAHGNFLFVRESPSRIHDLIKNKE